MDVLTKAEKYFLQLKEKCGDFVLLDKPEQSYAMPIMNINQENHISASGNVADNAVGDISIKKINKIEPDIMPVKKIKTSEKTADSDKTIGLQNEETLKVKNELTIDSHWTEAENLDELNKMIGNCLECPLGKTRHKFVFGKGNYNADIMFIGEGPGADEDAQGEPFVGRAGQLLTKIIESIEFTREEVFIANIVKCRPPGNRRPLESEVAKCEPYLKKQIQLIKPKFIVALGLTAVETLFKTKYRMGDIRGSLMNYEGIKLLVTYHPAALLRNPEWKRPVWEDMKLLKKLYNEYLQSEQKSM